MIDYQKQQTLQNSRFAHLVEHATASGTYCLFHALTLHKVYGGDILKSAHAAFFEPTSLAEARDHLVERYGPEVVAEVLADLEEKELIVTNTDADVTMYLHHLHTGAQMYSIRHAYFMPAADCNLRCSYCFVEDENRGFPTGRMTEATARKSLDVYAKLVRDADSPTLTFYGGEPLLNASVVYSSMHYIRELEQRHEFSKPVDITLLTNGVLVDETTVEEILETKAGVSISIDGPSDLHDSARIDVGKRGSFERALRGYRLLKDAGANPGVSVTLTRHNIHDIERIVEFVATELRPAGMGFNVLLPTVCSGNPQDVDHEYAAEQLLVAFRRLREYGIYEDRVMRRVNPFKDCYFHFKDCMGVGGQIVITPDGRIGPCQAFLGIKEYFSLDVEELHPKLKSLDSDELYSDPLFSEWRYRFPLNMRECMDCEAIAVCGGGCPYASLMNHGSIWSVDDRICFQAKRIFNWLIWDTYEHALEGEVAEGALG